ncbi:MAG: GTPase/DUF3482 domain-containing protein [Desulfobacterales bacterium]|nr:GTPase/DUF3482 domain-containing protein [Desulfobacterales bacterium]
MNDQFSIPAFAIIGHPNEGKSTIVSTLAENDRVRISPIPGETVECMAFPVKIDDRGIIRFIDTPGFQNPRKALAWFRKYAGNNEDIINAFIRENRSENDLSDECRLLEPVSKGAGIIYIVDGSRPVGKTDTIEMEILRLTGQPRIAVINSKDLNNEFIRDWKREFLKYFNSVRIFNGHTATYIERIELLDALRAIFQDWEVPLSHVIDSFRQDWANRNRAVASAAVEMLVKAITYKETTESSNDKELSKLKSRQLENYKNRITAFEKEICRTIKKRFRHNIFDYDLPPASILHADLFDEESIRVLGLKPNQIAIAGGVTGSMVGAAADIAAHGITFGLFTVIGGASGAGYAYINKNKMIRTRVAGFKIGKRKISTGPCRNIQFMYVLLDRILLYYSHVINWAHGRREPSNKVVNSGCSKQGMVSDFPDDARKVFDTMFTIVTKNKKDSSEIEKKAVMTLEKILTDISHQKNQVI